MGDSIPENFFSNQVLASTKNTDIFTVETSDASEIAKIGISNSYNLDEIFEMEFWSEARNYSNGFFGPNYVENYLENYFEWKEINIVQLRLLLSDAEYELASSTNLRYHDIDSASGKTECEFLGIGKPGDPKIGMPYQQKSEIFECTFTSSDVLTFNKIA